MQPLTKTEDYQTGVIKDYSRCNVLIVGDPGLSTKLRDLCKVLACGLSVASSCWCAHGDSARVMVVNIYSGGKHVHLQLHLSGAKRLPNS